MIVLGIESSCDETAAAVLAEGVLRSNVVASQAVHQQFGGVVPELASRAHQETIWNTVEQALQESGHSIQEVTHIAVTAGPGLMGALLVGLSFAKGLSLSHRIPLIGVNHMDAHIYANFIDDPQPNYPFLALVVSGGHTQLIQVDEPFKHRLLGQTLDDAAGEAFDKIGKLLGLPYPAGPVMDKLAQSGNPAFHSFPMYQKKESYDFSYSGLKTSVLYYLQSFEDSALQDLKKNHINDLCASVSHAITEPLVRQVKKAVKATGIKEVVLAGGVSANSMLRTKCTALAKKHGIKLHIPKMAYCTDNAAMIAKTGELKAQAGLIDNMSLKPFASL